jgi:hypothetical protein
MIVGRVDEMRNGKVYGWAFNSDNPDEHLEIRVGRSGALLASGRADKLRADLPEAGIGKGDHAFEIALPANISSFHGIILVARSQRSGEIALPIATNDERRVDDLFQIFSRRYDEILVALKADIDSVKGAEGQPSPNSASPPDIEHRLSQLEKRMDDFEVFIVRLDEIAKKLHDRINSTPSGGFLSFFSRRGK